MAAYAIASVCHYLLRTMYLAILLLDSRKTCKPLTTKDIEMGKQIQFIFETVYLIITRLKNYVTPPRLTFDSVFLFQCVFLIFFNNIIYI